MLKRGSILNFRSVGHHMIDSVLRLGYATRFIALTLLHSGTAFRRAASRASGLDISPSGNIERES